MSSVYTFSQIKEKLAPVFTEFGVREAILFGSYGKGIATEKSDIDLLVDSGLRGLKFVGLIDAVQKKLQKDVDIFDVTHITEGSPLEQEIRQTGVLLYEK